MAQKQLVVLDMNNNTITNLPTPSAGGDAVNRTYTDTKAPIASPTFTGTVSGITPAMVSLGNVNNTADTAKPVSTAQATAIASAKSRSAIIGLTSGDYPVSSYANASTAIAAALAASDDIFIKNGVYALTTDIQIIANNKTITGESETGTILRLNAGVNKSVITTGTNTGIITNCKITNLTIDQQGASQTTGGGGIILVGIQGWILENLTIPLSYNFGTLIQSQGAVADKTGTITLTTGSEMLVGSGTLFTTELAVNDIIKEPTTGEFARVANIISNTSVRLTKPWSFATQTTHTYKNVPANKNNKFINIKWQGTINAKDNAGFGLCDYGVIDKCTSSNSNGAGCGFVPDHSRAMMISNSTAINCGNSGFSYETCEDMVTTNCVSYGALTGNGYQLISGSSNCRVENMQTWANGAHGFVVNNNNATYPVPSKNSFIGVSAFENGGYGMRVDGANKTYVKGNFYNNTSGGFIQNTSNSIIPADTVLDTLSCYDDRTTKQQVYGIWLVTGTNATINLPHSLTADHVTAGINDTATATTIFTTDSGNVGLNNKLPVNPLSVGTATTAIPLADVLVGSSGATRKVVVLQGAASQTGNFMEVVSNANGMFFTMTSGGLLRGPTASAAAPTFSFHQEGGTGMYRPAGTANTLRLATAANDRFQVNTTGATFYGGMTMNRTAVGNVNYTIALSDFIVAYSTALTAARTVTLPDATVAGVLGQIYIIKDETNGAATNNIIVATTSAQTIDGTATKTINTNGGQIAVYSNGTNWSILWQVASGGGGTGTVNSATINALAYYATAGTAVSGNSGLTFELNNALRGDVLTLGTGSSSDSLNDGVIHLMAYSGANSKDTYIFATPSTATASTIWMPSVSTVLVGKDTVDTLTNKRLTPRINTTASSATPAINTDTTDQFTITALAIAITSMTTGLTGTPTDGQKLTIRIKGDATPRTIAWGTSFVSSGVATLLATTAASKTHMIGLTYDSAAAKWVCVAVDAVGY